MNFTNIKLTQNQQLIVNALLSMIGSALVSAAQLAYQYITQHGLINLQQVLLVFVGALWLSMSAALVAYIPAHVQQELEALRDLQKQVIAQPVASAPAQQPLVVIHTTSATATPVQNIPDGKALAQAVMPHLTNAIRSSSGVAVMEPTSVDGRQIALTNPTGGSTVPVPMPQAIPGDILGDLPVSNGLPSTVSQITGTIPVYGASGK